MVDANRKLGYIKKMSKLAGGKVQYPVSFPDINFDNSGK